MRTLLRCQDDVAPESVHMPPAPAEYIHEEKRDGPTDDERNCSCQDATENGPGARYEQTLVEEEGAEFDAAVGNDHHYGKGEGELASGQGQSRCAHRRFSKLAACLPWRSGPQQANPRPPS